MHTNLLSASEVQDLLDVDRSTIYRMASDGRLPAVKVGRQWRFPAEEIENLFDKVVGRNSRIDPALAFSIIDVMARPLGVQMLVTDVSGMPITAVANPCAWFEERADDPAVVTACVDEWRALADDLPHLLPPAAPVEGHHQVGLLGLKIGGRIVKGDVSVLTDPDEGEVLRRHLRDLGAGARLDGLYRRRTLRPFGRHVGRLADDAVLAARRPPLTP